MKEAKFVQKYQRKYNKSINKKKIRPYNSSKNQDIQGVPIQKHFMVYLVNTEVNRYSKINPMMY